MLVLRSICNTARQLLLGLDCDQEDFALNDLDL